MAVEWTVKGLYGKSVHAKIRNRLLESKGGRFGRLDLHPLSIPAQSTNSSAFWLTYSVRYRTFHHQRDAIPCQSERLACTEVDHMTCALAIPGLAAWLLLLESDTYTGLHPPFRSLALGLTHAVPR